METLIYNIDSRNRDLSKYPLETEFIIDLQDKIKNIVSINLSSIEYGNTSHVFTTAKDNNNFTIDDTPIIVPDGNYNSDDMITKINALIAEESITTVELSLDSNTGKVTITVTDDHIFDFTNSTDYKSLGECLGFEDLLFEITLVDESKTSTNIMNVIGEHYYFLKINDMGKVHHNNKIYFCKMIVNAPKYEVVYETRNRYVTKEVEFRQPINVQRLEVTIEDTFGNTVLQNGINVSFTLEFKVIRNDVLKKYKNISFYSKDVMKIMLYDKMLEHYNKKTGNNQTSAGFESIYHKLLAKSV